MKRVIKKITFLVLIMFLLENLNISYLANYVQAQERENEKIIQVTKENLIKDENTNTISFKLNLKNISDKKIDLNKLKVKYLFTDDDISIQESVVDWASISKDKYNCSITKLDAAKKLVNKEFNIAFKDSELKINEDINMNIRIYNKNYENFSQSNDYSFKNDVLVYYEDKLIYGVYPTEEEKVDNTIAVKLKAYNKVNEEKTTAIYPWIKLENIGGQEILLKDLKLRYYYSKDEKEDVKEAFICDWASIGKENVSGTFNKLEDSHTMTDSYLEIGFAENNLTLKKATVLELHTRFNKEGWKEYYQKNDVSFVENANDYIDWDKILVIYKDKVISGKLQGEKDHFTDMDDDNDGLSNEDEIKFGTNPFKADTDEDGLLDGFEVNYSMTNPLIKDTDNNGVLDGDEDKDNDGLKNIREQELNTDPIKADTDNDGLNDGIEINEYGTNPLKLDTDDDELSDEFEVKNNFDPLKTDSNDNGVIDSKESVSLKLTESSYKCNKEKAEPIVKITGTAEAIDNTVVENVEEKNYYEKLRYIVDTPIDIRSSESIKSAEISFLISKEILKNHKFENLCIVNYDPISNKVIPLKTKLDFNNKIISTTTSHLSIYAIIDRMVFSELLFLGGNGNYGSDLERGVANIVFSIDSTGSMSSAINNIKNNIDNFTNKLFVNNVKSYLGLTEFKDIDSDGKKSIINYGWFSNNDELIRILSNLNPSGGGDSPESSLEGLIESNNLLKDKTSSKFIILVTDDIYKENYNKKSDVIDKLKENNSKVYVISNNAYKDKYKEIYSETNGGFGDINSNFSLDLDSIISQISNSSKDGAWIRLSNGESIQLKEKPVVGSCTDSDGDGILDWKELKVENGAFKKSTVYDSVTGKYYEAYDFKTNPASRDTDGDGVLDSDDTLMPSKYISYLYYMEDAKEASKYEIKALKKEYGTKVISNLIDTASSLVDRWNNDFESEMKDSLGIKGVSIICHGRPWQMWFGDSSTTLVVSKEEKNHNKESSSKSVYLGNLKRKKIEKINLVSCNTGVLEYIYHKNIWGTQLTEYSLDNNEIMNNIALTLLKTQNVKEVDGWDGAVSFFLPHTSIYMPRLSVDQGSFKYFVSKSEIKNRQPIGKIRYINNSNGDITINFFNRYVDGYPINSNPYKDYNFTMKQQINWTKGEYLNYYDVTK